MRRYLHTCQKCVFIGTHANYDVYVCNADTVLMRYGSDASDYRSLDFDCGPRLAPQSPMRPAFVMASASYRIPGFSSQE